VGGWVEGHLFVQPPADEWMQSIHMALKMT